MNIQFVEKRKIYYIISSIILLAVVVTSFFPGPKLSIEFKGGSILSYNYSGTIDIDEVDEQAENIVGMEVTVLKTQDVNTNTTSIEISTAGTKAFKTAEINNITIKLQEAFPMNDIVPSDNNKVVEASIGRDFLIKGLLSLVLAALFIVIYIAFRFRKIGGMSAGVTGVIALVHDAVVIYLVYIILRIPLDQNFIAVILTILGYSINDTIVIYDRVRENKELDTNNTPIAKIVNTSINQSFIRSMNTSLTTVIALMTVIVIALIYDVGTIISFAVPLVIGMVSGVYSTLCIAGPLWVDWQSRKGRSEAVIYKAKIEKTKKATEKKAKEKAKAKEKKKKQYDKNKKKRDKAKEK